MLLSRFTPSVMPADTLEGIFVGRNHVLGAIMRRIGEAATSDTRNHTLLVGPRGAGKTHLIALTYHRTKAMIDTGAQLQLAWLPEDPWTVASYRHLLGLILERLETEPPLSGRGSEAEREARLVARAEADGTIVVLVENLDRILYQLGDTGQQKLRHFLQHECRMVLVATSTTLDKNLSDQARPFFSFFTSTRLQPFTPEQGRDMLAAIAERAGNQELVEFLHTDRGLGRVKAIAHLAGGQPRLWALLSSSLDVAELDSLVDLLMTRFDDLTPYYQEQLAAISPQQRLIVAELAEANHPLHVGALAARLEIDQRSLAKSVSDLVDRAWLRPVTTPFADLLDRRRTYYELAEPMARLAFQLKDSRGEPLRLVVDFIKSWFDPDDLERIDGDGRLGSYLPVLQLEFESDAVGGVVRRLTSLPITRAPALDLLGQLDDALAAAMDGDAGDLMELPTNLRVVLQERIGAGADRTKAMLGLRLTMHTEALDEVGNVPTKGADQWIRRAERLLATQPDDGPTQLILIRWLAHAWRFPEAEAALAALFSPAGDDQVSRLSATAWLAAAYQSAGKLKRAISLLEQNLADYERILGPEHPNTLTTRHNLAAWRGEAGDATGAVTAFAELLPIQERVLGPEHPNTLTTRHNLAAWRG
ncbi:MAG: tetratricopeptide repeat protein, partial [Micropruina sp.]